MMLSGRASPSNIGLIVGINHEFRCPGKKSCPLDVSDELSVFIEDSEAHPDDIMDAEVVLVIDEHRGGCFKFTRSLSFFPDRSQEIALLVKHQDVQIMAIQNIDISS